MRAATPAQAVAHPNWSMGAKISVDSATMMNKGLELIEAHHCSACRRTGSTSSIHPQSVVHSLVEFVDGSVLAQLGARTCACRSPMRSPGPSGWRRRRSGSTLPRFGRLDFEAPDLERFPALRLAREALEAGGAAPTVLNAANEVAVAAFLAGAIGFTDIAELVEQALERSRRARAASIAEVIEIDRRRARARCRP